MSLGVLLLVACSTSLMGCIITHDLDYQPAPNLPASVHDRGQPPMNRIYVIRSQEGEDAGVASNIEFTASVRDPNLDQTLEGLVFIDYDPDQANRPQLERLIIPPSVGDDRLTRRVSFTLSASQFTGLRCHTVQLHVSERFVGILDVRPADETDLGVGTWFVARPSGDDPVLVEECGTYP